MTAVAAPQKNATPWWLILIFGIAQIIVGILFWTDPKAMSVITVWVIGLYWLVTGAYYLVSLIWDRRRWGWKLFAGIIGILAGWFLVDPNGSTLQATLAFGGAVILVLAIQGIMMGIMGLIAAFQGGGWGAGIMGAISIVIGFLLLGNIWAATIVLPLVIAIFAIVGGIFSVIMAFRLK